MQGDATTRNDQPALLIGFCNQEQSVDSAHIIGSTRTLTCSETNAGRIDAAWRLREQTWPLPSGRLQVRQ